MRSIDYLGLDTETVDGYCRLLCLSDGRVFHISSLQDVWEFLMDFHRVQKTYFLAWNADFDIQALLLYFPKTALDTLIKGIPIVYKLDGESLSLQYIKGKFLEFDGNYIFDAMQYYGSSLKKAAEKYLPEEEQKGDFDASKINAENVYSEEVREYCLRDAMIAHKLFSKFHNSLPQNLKGTKPLSNAFYSYTYFRKELSFNKPRPDVGNYFRNGYHGGRFEIFERGHYTGLYNYDINSAYPYEISKLRGLHNARYTGFLGYMKDAAFSLYKIKVLIRDKFVSPLLSNSKGLCLYPSGEFVGYVTKGEYEAVKEWGPEILEAYHIYSLEDCPFAEKITALYEKKRFSGFPLPFKVILNSLYGKTGQSVIRYANTADLGQASDIVDFVDADGVCYVKFEDIANSNFVYASEITARTRLRMYEIVKAHPEDTVMVQTDSVISKIDLPELPLSDKMGEWKLEKWDEAYLIGSGIYFYRKGSEWFGKFRGFNFPSGKVEEILDRVLHTKTNKVSFQTKKRFSIQECNRLHDDTLANKIIDVTRNMDLNFDRKRVWLGEWKNGADIKRKQIKSLAIYNMEGA